MEQLRSLWTDHPFIMSAVVGSMAGHVVFIIYRKIRSKASKIPTVDCPPNTVVLYQWPRGPYAPSASNFPLKLETYLRLANISYVNYFSIHRSPKGKVPFITYNGELVSDSQFCIEYLNKKLDRDLNKSLTKEERAVAKAIQVMVEEHLYWVMVYIRWIYDKELKIVTLGVPNVKSSKNAFRRYVHQMLHSQGFGRYTTDEIVHILLSDLQALTDYLGNKPYMMGQTPCEVDCSVFGLLSQFIWNIADDICQNLVQDKFPSLYSYCLRMKEKAWPDWDDCITHGGTRSAPK
uniref:Thioredoxin-like fold domain-containing protein n=1 Tax=Arion vulgaris TaxID=1028688 RepID=A0A0B7AYA7_9EUPU